MQEHPFRTFLLISEFLFDPVPTSDSAQRRLELAIIVVRSSVCTVGFLVDKAVQQGYGGEVNNPCKNIEEQPGPYKKDIVSDLK